MSDFKFEFNPSCTNIRIIVRENNMGGKIIEQHEWLDLRPDIMIRWHWYFRYRAALCQVNYPKDHVHFQRWTTKPSEFSQEQINNQRIKRRITTCKRMITKISNGIKEYEDLENSKLLPDFENEYYLKAKMKLKSYQDELSSYINNDVS